MPLEGNGLYKLEYLPVARKDMIEIVRYISRELQNPDAADRLAVELVNAAESVLTFPYAAPAYQPIRSLKHEYRKILVQNYLMFYWVDEEERLVSALECPDHPRQPVNRHAGKGSQPDGSGVGAADVSDQLRQLPILL